MKKLLFALILIPFIAFATDQIDISANSVLASNLSMKPDARHAAVSIALVDKAGHTITINPLTGKFPLSVLESGSNVVLSTGTTNLTLITGTGTLSSGTATIANTAVRSTSKILITPVGITNAGFVGLGTIVSGTSFGVLSSSGSDARVFSYLIQN